MKVPGLTLEMITRLFDREGASAFNRGLQRAIEDCLARPLDDKTRKVLLQAELTPSEGGILVQCQVKEAFPAVATKTVLMVPERSRGGQLSLTFPDGEEEAA